MVQAGIDALLKAGEVLMAQGRLQEAQELHTRAHRAAPEDLGPLYALVADADARDDADTARSYLKRIIELKPHEAVRALRRLRDLDMAAGEVYYVRGEILWGIPAGRPKFSQQPESQALADIKQL